MQALLATQRCWLVVERLAAYAPDFNLAEALWGNVKNQEFANLCVDSIAETEQVARQSTDRARNETQLTFFFLRHTGFFS